MTNVNTCHYGRRTLFKGMLILSLLASTSPQGWTMDQKQFVSPMGEAADSLRASSEALKDRYTSLYQTIGDLHASSLHFQNIGQYFDYFISDTDQKPLKTAAAEEIGRQKSLMLEDISGIGLYTIAYYLADAWAKGEIFQQYKAVIVLPIEEIFKKLSLDTLPSLENLFALWGAQWVGVKPEDILVILSGCSEKIRCYSQDKAAEKTLKEEWINYVQREFNHIIVSNATSQPYLKPTPSGLITVSLAPSYLHVEHLKERSEAVSYYIPGQLILEEARVTTEQVFFKEPKESEGSIKTTPEWHTQVQEYMRGGDLRTVSIKPQHVYEPLTPQAFIKEVIKYAPVQPTALSDSPSTASPDYPVPAASEDSVFLKDPSQWFAAAITAPTQEKSMACYRVGSSLIVRNLENHYVACYRKDFLSETSEQSSDLLKGADKDNLKDFFEILKSLAGETGFEGFDIQTIKSTLESLTSEKKKSTRSNLSGNSDKKLTKLQKHLLNNDPVNKKFNKLFAKNNPDDLTYRAIQEGVNALIEDPTFDFMEVALKILKGEGPDTIDISDFTVGLSAVMLGETKRYPVNFLATLCLFDLIQDRSPRNEIEKIFFYPTELLSSQSADFEGGIRRNVLHTLGGLHPMSQGNSYNQVAAAQKRTEQGRNINGLNLVDFKMQYIFFEWLKKSIEREKDLNPHFTATIANIVPPGKNIATDLVTYFSDRDLWFASPYVFDRFNRRLESFNYGFDGATPQPIRTIFPKNVQDVQRRLDGENFKPIRARYLDVQISPWCIHPSMIYRLKEAWNAETEITAVMDEVKNNNLSDTQKSEAVHTIAANLEKAENSYLAIIKMDPDFYLINYFLSKIYLIKHETHEKALEYINKYLEKASPEEEYYKLGLFVRIRCRFLEQNGLGVDQALYDPWIGHSFSGLLNVVYTHDHNIEDIRKDLDLIIVAGASSEVTEIVQLYRVGILINESSAKFSKGFFSDALQGYLMALTEIYGPLKKYQHIISMGDLYESLGDSYKSLDKIKDAYGAFKNALEMHIKYKPNERAFLIPEKIFSLYKRLDSSGLLNEIQLLLVRTQKDFEPHKDIHLAGMTSVDKCVLAVYVAQGDYTSALKIVEKIGIDCLGERDRKALGEWKEIEQVQKALIKSYGNTKIAKSNTIPKHCTTIELSIKGSFGIGAVQKCLSQTFGLTPADIEETETNNEFSISFNTSHIAKLNQLSGGTRPTDPVTTLFFTTHYDNALLNYPHSNQLLNYAQKKYGTEAFDKLLDLGTDGTVAQNILRALEQQSVPEVASLLLGLPFNNQVTPPQSLQALSEQGPNFQPENTQRSIALREQPFQVASSSQTSSVTNHLFKRFDEFFGKNMGWRIKYWTNYDQISQLKKVLQSYNIDESFYTISFSPSDYKKKVLLPLHPDKGGSQEDFLLANSLYEAFYKDINFNSLLLSAGNTLHKATIITRRVDAGIDTLRAAHNPTWHNIWKVGTDIISIYSLNNVGIYSSALVISGIAYSFYHEDYSGAGKQIAFAALPVIVGIAFPAIGTTYTAALSLYSLYSTAYNGYSLWQEYTLPGSQSIFEIK